jgi:hypothetical protein
MPRTGVAAIFAYRPRPSGQESGRKQPGEMRNSGPDATAYHEAGHIVMAWHVGESPTKAAIGKLRRGVVGATSYEQPMAMKGELDPRSDRSRLAAERAIMVSLAGPAAQRRFRPSSWRRAHGMLDHSRATALAAAVTDSPRQAQALLKFLGIRVDDALAAEWNKVEAVAKQLAKKHELSHGDIVAILTEM